MGGSSNPDASANLYPSPGSRATRPSRDTSEAVLMDFERDMDRSPQVGLIDTLVNRYSNFTNLACFAHFHTNPIL